ncbi:MAG: hypothetical protein DA408_06075 [Bacteroidetes bacterium]|nr:MAG: hypothetical protein C7N36_09580 [Bacteroidota bacterium]PTM13698.1 MAG: hypothetical protein DA408_06075 [Bacteroidota bacterium]
MYRYQQTHLLILLERLAMLAMKMMDILKLTRLVLPSPSPSCGHQDKQNIGLMILRMVIIL